MAHDERNPLPLAELFPYTSSREAEHRAAARDRLALARMDLRLGNVRAALHGANMAGIHLTAAAALRASMLETVASA